MDIILMTTTVVGIVMAVIIFSMLRVISKSIKLLDDNYKKLNEDNDAKGHDELPKAIEPKSLPAGMHMFASEVMADNETAEQHHATEVLNEKIKWIEKNGNDIVEAGIKIVFYPNIGTVHKVYIKYTDKTFNQKHDN